VPVPDAESLALSLLVRRECDRARAVCARLAETCDESRRLVEEAQLRRAGRPRPAPQRRTPLTARQLEILRDLADGASTRDVARRHWLTPVTVRNHIANILRNLGAHSRLEAVSIARRSGLL
jgi:LuxR family transcriptional regulator, regulator of acetate metabolism